MINASSVWRGSSSGWAPSAFTNASGTEISTVAAINSLPFIIPHSAGDCRTVTETRADQAPGSRQHAAPAGRPAGEDLESLGRFHTPRTTAKAVSVNRQSRSRQRGDELKGKDQKEQTAQTERSGKGSLLSVVSVASCWVPVAARVTAFAQLPESILGGARLILATTANGKSMSPLLRGLESRGQLIVAGAGGNEPIEVNPGPLLFGRRSIAGTMTGSSIDAEDTLSFSSLQQIRPMIETVPLANADEAYGRMMRNEARFRIVLVTGQEQRFGS